MLTLPFARVLYHLVYDQVLPFFHVPLQVAVYLYTYRLVGSKRISVNIADMNLPYIIEEHLNERNFVFFRKKKNSLQRFLFMYYINRRCAHGKYNTN